MILAITKFLVFAIIVAVLLPAGREMLDDLVREFSSTKHQAVLKPGQPDRIGRADSNKNFATGSGSR
jgi:hypothetical protein